ncbi:MAG: hypothetical protein SPI59_03115 [Finegoldia sp.]|nr:hypothetical protein [Finegoldia sp.]
MYYSLNVSNKDNKLISVYVYFSGDEEDDDKDEEDELIFRNMLTINLLSAFNYYFILLTEKYPEMNLYLDISDKTEKYLDFIEELFYKGKKEFEEQLGREIKGTIIHKDYRSI